MYLPQYVVAVFFRDALHEHPCSCATPIKLAVDQDETLASAHDTSCLYASCVHPCWKFLIPDKVDVSLSLVLPKHHNLPIRLVKAILVVMRTSLLWIYKRFLRWTYKPFKVQSQELVHDN
jgi:hypothetical protein